MRAPQARLVPQVNARSPVLRAARHADLALDTSACRSHTPWPPQAAAYQ